MITIKNKNLDSDTISVLNELVDTEMSAIAAFKLMKVISQLDEIVKNRQKAEINLVKKYAQKDDNGEIVVPTDKDGNKTPGTYAIEDSKSEEFNKQINELYEFENELDFNPIDFQELGIEKISIKKLMKIKFLIKDSE